VGWRVDDTFRAGLSFCAILSQMHSPRGAVSGSQRARKVGSVRLRWVPASGACQL
jgi:hypothetical protein